MYEVELKIRADHATVEPRVQERTDGSIRVHQIDTYFDAPHRSFAETDEALRVREERTDDGVTFSLTYKGPLVDDHSKTRTEYETVIDDANATRDILRSLGFQPVATVEKERIIYDIDEFVVSLDSVESVGEFVEVETETPDENFEALRDRAKDVLESLGLNPDEHIQTSYLEMVLDG